MKRLIVNDSGQALVVNGNALIQENGYVENGLIAFFDGWNKGETADAWTDLVSGIVFTNHGATSLVNGWNFDGTDDYMTSDSDSLRLPYATTTLEIVVGVSDSAPRRQYIFIPKSGVSNVIEVCFYSDAYLRITTSTGKHKALWVSGSNTISCAGESVYLDGTETTYDSGGYIGAISSNRLGSGNGANFFKGKIYCLRAYNRVLTAAEIKRNQKIDQLRYINPPVQLVQNGNFANGTTGLSSRYANTSVSNGVLTVEKAISGSAGASVWFDSVPGLDTTHLYYMKALARKADDSSGYNAVMHFQTSSYTTGGNTTVYNGGSIWRWIDQVTSPQNNTDRFALRTGSASSAQGVIGYYQNVNLIDLTATFGAGNEPTLEQCRAIFTEDYYEYYNPNE